MTDRTSLKSKMRSDFELYVNPAGPGVFSFYIRKGTKMRLKSQSNNMIHYNSFSMISSFVYAESIFGPKKVESFSIY